MPLSKEDSLFARIVVHNKLASDRQVKQCSAIAEREGKSLGETLFVNGFINDKQLRQVEAHVQKKLGVKAPSPTAQTAAPAGGSASAGVQAKPDGVTTVEELAAQDFSSYVNKSLHDLLQELRKAGVSDLHCQVGAPPFARLHGSLVYLKHPPYEKADLEKKIYGVLNDQRRKEFEKHWDTDFCLDTDHGRYRTSVLKQRLGTDAIFRIIPTKIKTLEELHLPEYLGKFGQYSQGIVLITGPAGCGKTATMAALTRLVNETRRDHIVTVEDPIEYVFESDQCNVNQREVVVHTENFATALRSALRADPDVIVIGEMRDLETVSIAVTAAETGHLVLGTLHTTTAIRSIDRIIDVFPPKEQDQIRAMVAESMRGVISQQLVPRKDGFGREPALEIMFATPAVANMIRDKKTFQLSSVLQTGSRLGMKVMDDSVQALLDKGVITRESAVYYATQPKRFKQ